MGSVPWIGEDPVQRTKRSDDMGLGLGSFSSGEVIWTDQVPFEREADVTVPSFWCTCCLVNK